MDHCLHVVDESFGWEQRVALSQLLDRLPSDRFGQSACCIGDASVELTKLSPACRSFVPGFGSNTWFSAPFLARRCQQSRVSVLHAWGIQAALTARSAGAALPLIVHLFDPAVAKKNIGRLRAAARSGGFAIDCSTQLLRRRLIEGGLAPELCVVIRPAVDFGAINRWKRSGLREQLGVSRDQKLISLIEPALDPRDQRDAFLAATLVELMGADLRVAVPASFRSLDGLARFARNLQGANPLLIAPYSTNYEQLLSVSDVLLSVTRGDVSTSAISWAMASNATVIGTAVHSVAELIAHRVNGLLFKRSPDRSVIPSLARLIRTACGSTSERYGTTPNSSMDKEPFDVARLKQAAHGQAFEVFGLRRYVDQHVQLIRNLLTGVSPSEGISDSAMVG